MSKDPHSTHYDAGGIETIDIIRAKLTAEQYRGYLLGNVLKYACRLEWKGFAESDARKLATYAMWLAEESDKNHAALAEFDGVVSGVTFSVEQQRTDVEVRREDSQDEMLAKDPAAPPRKLVRVEPQPLPSFGDWWDWWAPDGRRHSGRRDGWWRSVPDECRPRPSAPAERSDGIWYWAIPQDEEATKCSQ